MWEKSSKNFELLEVVLSFFMWHPFKWTDSAAKLEDVCDVVTTYCICVRCKKWKCYGLECLDQNPVNFIRHFVQGFRNLNPWISRLSVREWKAQRSSESALFCDLEQLSKKLFSNGLREYGDSLEELHEIPYVNVSLHKRLSTYHFSRYSPLSTF